MAFDKNPKRSRLFHPVVDGSDKSKYTPSQSSPVLAVSRSRKGKYNILSLNEKVRLIHEVLNGKRKKKDIAADFGILPNTLSTIIKNKDAILRATNGRSFAENRKRMKTSSYPMIEEEMVKWLNVALKRRVSITGLLLREKAEELANKFGYTGFKASAGWLGRFKNRNGISQERRKRKGNETENEKLGISNQNPEERIGSFHQSGNVCSTAAEKTRLFYEEKASPYIAEESSLKNPSVTVPELERLCRLCLAELDAFTNIFEFDDIHRFNIADAINDLLGMDMNPSDGYPGKICGSCLLEVVHFRRFKGKCFESKAKLKEMVDEKNYFSGSIKMESDDDLFEAVENEITDIPVKCEVNEDSGSENDNMLQALVNSDVISSEENPDECGPSREAGATILTNPFQSCLDVDKIGKATPQRSKKKGRLTVRKTYLFYTNPCAASDGVVDSQDHCSNVNSGQCSDSISTKKSKSVYVCDSESPVDNQGMVSIKLEETSDGELCSEEKSSSNKGYLSAR